MEASNDTAPATVERWRTRGRTTIVLAQNDAGEWRATQEGVNVEGRGERAAVAAADYCRRLEERDGCDA